MGTLLGLPITEGAAIRIDYTLIRGVHLYPQDTSSSRVTTCHIPPRYTDGRRDEDFDKLVDKIYIFDCGNRGRSLRYLVDEGVIDEIPHNSQAPCAMVFNRLHITADGYLSACCADHYGDLLVADLRNMSLKDAWYSDIMIDLRKQHLTGFTENNACNSCINNATGKIKPLMCK